MSFDIKEDCNAEEAIRAHYGMRPSRNNPGIANENGSIESATEYLKRSTSAHLAVALALGRSGRIQVRDRQSFTRFLKD
jgi:hypothetical protein